MKDKNDILNNKVYAITNYITNFFITNLWFLVMISPIIIYIYIFEGNISMSILLLLSILVGPALTALFSIMGKLVREGDIAPTKDFFHFYKMNFLQSLLVGIILNILISITYFDMNYFSSKGNKYFSYIFLALLALIIMLSIYIYPIISRYNIKIVHLFKISIKLLIKKIYISLSCISIIIIVLGLVRITRLSLVGVLFGVSIIGYLIMRMEKNIIDELEEEIKEKYKNI
ncbi:hypothetical protein psyc5s11_02240 [Clostridium gelidum]|uniref:DUF624 domain-containing protein n=1 Tax=Clostridium gelidum TaxID=704125 RepID=A0ABM7SZ34_9CLOT|nr:YesL family protein [Clostridium gelidum]BCZ44157.1 hypothetical protein psyc5s11_02240 [Clostridium gelidum]